MHAREETWMRGDMDALDERRRECSPSHGSSPSLMCSSSRSPSLIHPDLHPPILIPLPDLLHHHHVGLRPHAHLDGRRPSRRARLALTRARSRRGRGGKCRAARGRAGRAVWAGWRKAAIDVGVGGEFDAGRPAQVDPAHVHRRRSQPPTHPEPASRNASRPWSRH
jgi:hypothetical protein